MSRTRILEQATRIEEAVKSWALGDIAPECRSWLLIQLAEMQMQARRLEHPRSSGLVQLPSGSWIRPRESIST